MATIYTEFTTNGANILADIRTAILTSTDWSRPNSGTLPNMVKCTTTRGADMIVNLGDAAVTQTALQIAAFRTHDGTTGVDKLVRYVRYKQSASGTLATMPIRCVVSAGKEHLFVGIEGPRPGEDGSDHAQMGSLRTYFFFADVVPYFEAPDDTVPCVAFGGGRNTNAVPDWANGSYSCNISRTRDNIDSWAVARLPFLDVPQNLNNNANQLPMQRTTLAGTTLLSSYVVFEDKHGPRGRLSSFFFAGWNNSMQADAPILAAGSKQTVDGVPYRLLAVNKTGGNNEQAYDVLGSVSNSTQGNQHRSALVAVPSV